MLWQVKGTLQKILGKVPRGDIAHLFLQRRLGGLAGFDRECSVKFRDFELMEEQLQALHIPISGAHIVEIGSGWYPTFPLSLYVLGAASVDTYDLTRHYNQSLVDLLVGRLRKEVGTLAARNRLPITEVAARMATVGTLHADGIAGTTVRYHAPGDAARTNHADASIDLVFSNSVLEHIPEPIIGDIFNEARRILKPGGRMFHSVDCGDHYAYFDKFINKLNYLRYSEESWQFWNNEFLYQNRLRAPDFIRLAESAGFAIERSTAHATAERLDQLRAMPVDPCFARYSEEELAITTIDFVARKR